MKLSSPVLLIVQLSLSLLSCTQEATYTVTGVYDDRILVSQNKETMERVIECAVTRECQPGFVMELLPTRKVFFLKSGTKVTTRVGLFAFSDAIKVHILDGEHRGEDAWVYDRMLYEALPPDQSQRLPIAKRKGASS